MPQTFSFLFVLLALISCGRNNSDQKAAFSITQAEITLDEVVPIQAQTFEVDPILNDFEKEHEEKIFQAIDLIKKVVAAPEFKMAVLNHTYQGIKQFSDNNGKSNFEIYASILKAAEVLNPHHDNVMNLNLKSYYTRSNVIGYTKPNIPTIYLNTRYLSKEYFRTNEVAMNLIHEWLHKLGYTHDFLPTPSRKFSVPYGVGYIMQRLSKNYM